MVLMMSKWGSKKKDECAVIRKFRITAADGKSYETIHYYLKAIIAIGYKVNSGKTVQFRKWATDINAVIRKFRTTATGRKNWRNWRRCSMGNRRTRTEPAPCRKLRAEFQPLHSRTLEGKTPSIFARPDAGGGSRW